MLTDSFSLAGMLTERRREQQRQRKEDSGGKKEIKKEERDELTGHRPFVILLCKYCKMHPVPEKLH